MYKLKYTSYGMPEEVTSRNIEPLQQLLRNLFTLHNNFKGSTENFELIFFGEVTE
jgi:hypothetical protein